MVRRTTYNLLALLLIVPTVLVPAAKWHHHEPCAAAPADVASAHSPAGSSTPAAPQPASDCERRCPACWLMHATLVDVPLAVVIELPQPVASVETPSVSAPAAQRLVTAQPRAPPIPSQPA